MQAIHPYSFSITYNVNRVAHNANRKTYSVERFKKDKNLQPEIAATVHEKRYVLHDLRYAFLLTQRFFTFYAVTCLWY